MNNQKDENSTLDGPEGKAISQPGIFGQPEGLPNAGDGFGAPLPSQPPRRLKKLEAHAEPKNLNLPLSNTNMLYSESAQGSEDNGRQESFSDITLSSNKTFPRPPRGKSKDKRKGKRSVLHNLNMKGNPAKVVEDEGMIANPYQEMNAPSPDKVIGDEVVFPEMTGPSVMTPIARRDSRLESNSTVSVARRDSRLESNSTVLPSHAEETNLADQSQFRAAPHTDGSNPKSRRRRQHPRGNTSTVGVRRNRSRSPTKRLNMSPESLLTKMLQNDRKILPPRRFPFTEPPDTSRNSESEVNIATERLAFVKERFIKSGKAGNTNISLENVYLIPRKRLESVHSKVGIIEDHLVKASSLNKGHVVLFVSHGPHRIGPVVEAIKDEHLEIIRSFLYQQEAQLVTHVWIDYYCMTSGDGYDAPTENAVFQSNVDQLFNIHTAVLLSSQVLVIPSIESKNEDPFSNLLALSQSEWHKLEVASAMLFRSQIFLTFQQRAMRYFVEVDAGLIENHLLHASTQEQQGTQALGQRPFQNRQWPYQHAVITVQKWYSREGISLPKRVLSNWKQSQDPLKVLLILFNVMQKEGIDFDRVAAMSLNSSCGPGSAIARSLGEFPPEAQDIAVTANLFAYVVGFFLKGFASIPLPTPKQKVKFCAMNAVKFSLEFSLDKNKKSITVDLSKQALDAVDLARILNQILKHSAIKKYLEKKKRVCNLRSETGGTAEDAEDHSSIEDTQKSPNTSKPEDDDQKAESSSEPQNNSEISKPDDEKQENVSLSNSEKDDDASEPKKNEEEKDEVPKQQGWILRLGDNYLGYNATRVLLRFYQLGQHNVAGSSFENSVFHFPEIKYNQLNLAEICLECNGVGNAGAKELAKISTLKKLNLKANIIGDEGAEALSKLPLLEILDLYQNHVGDEGTKALAKSQSLSALSLRWNRVGIEGIEALSRNSVLTTLNLANNCVGDDGAKLFANSQSITALGLRQSRVGDQGAKALSKNGNLFTLNLQSNFVGDEGAKGLANCPCLTSLNLYNNWVGNDGATALAESSSLTSLNLGLNRLDLDKPNDKEVVKALLDSESICRLYLLHTWISHDNKRELLQFEEEEEEDCVIHYCDPPCLHIPPSYQCPEEIKNPKPEAMNDQSVGKNEEGSPDETEQNDKCCHFHSQIRYCQGVSIKKKRKKKKKAAMQCEEKENDSHRSAFAAS